MAYINFEDLFQSSPFFSFFHSSDPRRNFTIEGLDELKTEEEDLRAAQTVESLWMSNK